MKLTLEENPSKIGVLFNMLDGIKVVTIYVQKIVSN
jgi:hypothetical protein